MIISSSFFIIILSIFAFLWLLLGFRAAKTIATPSDYFLAGKQLGVIPITLTLMATQIGGGFLSGITQESYHAGLYGVLYALGMSVGFILLGLGVAGKLQALQVRTTAEIFQTIYGSNLLKKIASVSFITSLLGIFIAQIVAFKTIMYGLGITSIIFITLFWLSVIAHTVIGGFKAVVLIDNVKQIFILCVFSGIFLYSIITFSHQGWSFDALFAMQKNYFTMPDVSWLYLLPTFLMPALFSLIEQDLAQSFFAARSARAAAVAAFYASILLTAFSMLPVYFGIETKLLALPVAAGANPLVSFLSYACNGIMFVVAIIALITAITSTANSLLCAVSAHITQDFFEDIEHERGLRMAQHITLLAGLVGLIISYFVGNQILAILTTSYELSVSMLFMPLCIAYFFPVQNYYRAAWFSTIAGFIMFFVGRFWAIGVAQEILTLSFSFLAFIIGTFLQNK